MVLIFPLRKAITLLCCVFISAVSGYAQLYSKLQADFSIKESGDAKKVTIGTVYFEKFSAQIVYNIRYPQEEVIVVTDSVVYRIIDNKIVDKKPANGIVPFSIFYLALNGDLDLYGLRNTPYTLSSTKATDGQVITTWLPPKEMQEYQGKVMLSQKNGLVFGLLGHLPDGTLLSKQFFEDYVNVKGLDFPQKIVQIMYAGGKENYKVTTYRNIDINNTNPESEKYYHYKLPDSQ